MMMDSAMLCAHVIATVTRLAQSELHKECRRVECGRSSRRSLGIVQVLAGACAIAVPPMAAVAAVLVFGWLLIVRSPAGRACVYSAEVVRLRLAPGGRAPVWRGRTAAAHEPAGRRVDLNRRA